MKRTILRGSGVRTCLEVVSVVLLHCCTYSLPSAALETPHTILTGGGAEYRFGTGGESGDFDGDGYTDLLVGAYGYQSNQGRAYVFFGGPGADDIADLILTGQGTGDRFGNDLGGIGDVNADGFDDFIVNAYEDNTGVGQAYVYFGGPSLDDVPDLHLVGFAPGDQFGASSAGIGDFNNDGFGDFIVGQDSYGTLNNPRGRAYVYFGGPGVDATPDMTLSYAVDVSCCNQFGFDTAGIGDVNADGVADVLVCDISDDTTFNNGGRAYVYFGGNSPDAVADLVLNGPSPEARFGSAGCGLGDVNGDGYNDFAVGARDDNLAATDAGAVYIFFGGPAIDDVPDVTLVGETSSSRLGGAVSPAGDFDGDGHRDILVGAYGYGGSTGRAYVYRGGPVLDDQPDFTMEGEGSVDIFGAGVAFLGDFDSNGRVELVVGAVLNDAGGPNAGRAYLFEVAGGASAVAEVTGSSTDALTVAPNPFAASAAIRYQLPSSSRVDLRVFDVSGRLIRVLEEGRPRRAGDHVVTWDGRDSRGFPVPAGTYFSRMVSGSLRATRKMVLVR